MVVLVVAGNTRVTLNSSIKMDQVMLQPHSCVHEFKKRGQSLVFMRGSTQKEFSQYRTPHGPQSSSQFNWQRSQSSSIPTEIIMVGQHLRIMITTTGHLVDHLTHDTIRATIRSLIEVMATPENIISQRVTVSLNQNGCSLE